VSLEIVGATGNRTTRKFFEEECKGLRVRAAPGDPVPAYHRAEVFVLPSLHDGFGFVVAEAMACGLPVIVTEDCGAASWVREGRTGWIVPSASVDALVDALSDAMRRRKELPTMGSVARTDVELLAGPSRLNHLRDWFYRGIKPNGNHSHDN
jgi:glycosyltransferase involved in cell wall biosynthesis